MTPLAFIVILLLAIPIGIEWAKYNLAKDIRKQQLWQAELDFHMDTREMGKKTKKQYIQGQYNTITKLAYGY